MTKIADWLMAHPGYFALIGLVYCIVIIGGTIWVCVNSYIHRNELWRSRAIILYRAFYAEGIFEKLTEEDQERWINVAKKAAEL